MTVVPASSDPLNPDASSILYAISELSQLPRGAPGTKGGADECADGNQPDSRLAHNDFCWTVAGELVFFPPLEFDCGSIDDRCVAGARWQA